MRILKRDIKHVLILFNKNFYKEFDIDNFDCEELTIGLEEDNEIKLNLDINMKISLKILKNNNYWEIIEGENLYCIINGIKTSRKKMMHGDQISIKLKSNKIELFKINFFVDFVSGKENYDKIAYLENKEIIKIGSNKENNIFINDFLIDKNHCYLKREKHNLYSLVDMNSRYSIYVNGKKVEGARLLNKNDFIIICGYKFLFMEDKILFSNYNEKIKINNLKIDISAIAKSALVYPEFIRSPRYRYNLPKELIEIVEPPALGTKPDWEMFLPLVSTIAMSGMYVFLMPGNAIFSLGSTAVTILVTIMMFSIKSKQHKKEKIDRNKKYINYIEEQEVKISSLYNEQKRISNIIYPEIKEAIKILNDFKVRLWEKDKKHEDFLEINLGKGIVNISFEVKIPKEKWGKTDDDLILKPKELKEKYENIENMPITLNLKKEEAIAVIGTKELVTQYIYNLLIQVVTYHHYEDVKIVFVYDEDEDENWSWIRWLPHIWSDNKKVRFIGRGKDSAHIILQIANDVLSMKEEKNITEAQHTLFFITNPELLKNEQIALYLERNETKGYTPIFLYESIQVAPKNCTSIIEILDDKNGIYRKVESAESITKFNYENIEIEDYEEFSRMMAPVYVKETFSASSLPKMITLYDLYGVTSARYLPVLENWKTNNVSKTMAAPLGINMAGEQIVLDLHEKVHGPHGLVAGTTGSGKSEIIQSFIVSLAINYHPYDISFILIDYKGGGMANLFKDLPHLIGTITNLDGNAVNRSLALIKSELKRRQSMFSKNDVNHIDGYKKLEKEKNLEPLPHLVIIADEFAELKSNQPDFMQELVSAARIGRSLGVHLILATQKPSGVVDDQIWSNSKFKLCLKVQDASDSNELLKKPDAANIVDPGRAYFQVGNNEIYELFQSAWSGAKKYEDDELSGNDIEISEVSVEGGKRLLYSSKEALKNKKYITQLEDTILYINKLFYSKGYKKIDDCWVPPLEEILFIDELIKEEDYFYNNKESLKVTIEAVVGIFDSPEMQKKFPYKFNFTEDGNLVIIGAPGYGKTILLQTLILSLTLNYSPKDVNLYILDFGTRTLKIFEKSVHVGGVVLSDDEEKLENLIKMIKKEIIKRKKDFSDYGASNLNNYRVASGKFLPQIIIIIDNFVALRELYEQYEDDFIFFAREGATLGISLIISGNSYNDVSFRMIGNFKMKATFTCIDNSEYANLFNKVGLSLSPIKGRVLVEHNEINEMQVALPGTTEEEVDRIKEIKELINNVETNYKGEKAKLIPLMPEVILLDEILEEIKESNEFNSVIVPCGFSSDKLENRYFKLSRSLTFAIVGESKSGKTNILKNIIEISEVINKNSKFIIFDSYSSGLKSMKTKKNILFYANDDENYKEIFEYIEIECERRSNIINERLELGEEEEFILKEFDELILIIDNIGEFGNKIEAEYEYSDIINKIIKEFSNCKISFIAAGIEEQFNDYAYSIDFVKVMKENQVGILLNYVERQRFFDIQIRYGVTEKELKKGDGYFVNKNYFDRIKIPKN
ncbi:MAG: type VII secretion protein EssC [Clostridium sp.]|uniref:type VII secretion protein EssC n=1 Tax=Clostridium sp. TaxID=1506 RepID=UPI003EE60C08